MTDNTPLKQDFRHAMASCAAGVHVITTDGAAGRYGITMTAVSSITDEPPTVMLCINRSAAIIPILQTNRDLCINVPLRADSVHRDFDRGVEQFNDQHKQDNTCQGDDFYPSLPQPETGWEHHQGQYSLEPECWLCPSMAQARC